MQLDAHKLKTQQDIVDLFDSIDVLRLGISKILVEFDKGFYSRKAKPKNERYIEEYCVTTISNALLDEFYGTDNANRPEPQKIRTIVTNKF